MRSYDMKDQIEIDKKITYILEQAAPAINKLHASKEVYDYVSCLFATNAVSASCSKSILDKLRKIKSFTKSIAFVYDIMLAGEGLGEL